MSDDVVTNAFGILEPTATVVGPDLSKFGTEKWSGAASGADGCLYGAPYRMCNLLRIKCDDIRRGVTVVDMVPEDEQALQSTADVVFDRRPPWKNLWTLCCQADHGPISIWRPTLQEGEFYFGDRLVCGREAPDAHAGVVVARGANSLFPRPIAFRLIWSQERGGACYFWEPVPPSDDFVALGDVVTTSSISPSCASLPGLRCCARSLLSSTVCITRAHKIWSDEGTGGEDGCMFRAPTEGLFVVQGGNRESDGSTERFPPPLAAFGELRGTDSASTLLQSSSPANTPTPSPRTPTPTTTSVDLDALSGFGEFKFSGAASALNGSVYFSPCNASSVLCFDPTTKCLSSIAHDLYPSLKFKWLGATRAPDGCIFCIPYNAPKVLRIDPVKHSAAVIGEDLSTFGDGKYSGAAVGGDGNIYCVPYNARRILCINPNTLIVSEVGQDLSAFGDAKYSGAAAGVDGAIFAIPYDAHRVLRYDPVRQNATPIGIDLCKACHGTMCKWQGGALACDGSIYCAPYNASHVLRIDPSNQSTTLIGDDLSVFGDCKFGELAVCSGILFCIPRSAPKVLRATCSLSTERIRALVASERDRAAFVQQLSDSEESCILVVGTLEKLLCFPGEMYSTMVDECLDACLDSPSACQQLLVVAIQQRMLAVVTRLFRADVSMTEESFAVVSSNSAAVTDFAARAEGAEAVSCICRAIPQLGSPALLAAISACAGLVVTRLVVEDVSLDDIACEKLLTNSAIKWHSFVKESSCTEAIVKIATRNRALALSAVVCALSLPSPDLALRLFEARVPITADVRHSLVASGFWHRIVQLDRAAPAVAEMAKQSVDLMEEADSSGRHACKCRYTARPNMRMLHFFLTSFPICLSDDMAVMSVKVAWDAAVEFCGFIKLVSSTTEHKSATCVILRGVAKHSGDNAGVREGDEVVVKLMKDEVQFTREIEMRAGIADDSVVTIVASSNDEQLRERWASDAAKHGYTEYPHGIVMKAAQRNLMVILVRRVYKIK